MLSQNLTHEDEFRLFTKLTTYIQANTTRINLVVAQHKLKKKTFSVIELTNNIILVLKNENRTSLTKIHIGFPFPIASKDITIQSYSDLRNITADFYIRGQWLRAIQKKSLIDILKTLNRKIIYTEISQKADFRKITKQYFHTNKNVAYIDPYNNPNETHIGNSFIGLHFVDSFKANFKIKNITVVSNSHDHLQEYYHSVPKNLHGFNYASNRAEIVILPPVVDFRFIEVIKEILYFCQKRKVILLVSRNMIIDATSAEIKVYTYQNRDILLTNKSIDDYMDKCLDPFIQKKCSDSTQIITSTKINTFFINPFSASEIKDISPLMVIKVINELHTLTNGKSIIYLSAGLKGNSKDERWTAIFKKNIADLTQLKNSIKYCPYFNNLSELLLFLKEKQISAALTPDTAVAHLLNRGKIPNITFFNTRFWDLSSMQSVCTMFCRYYPWQIPAVFVEGADNDSFANAIANGIIFLGEKNKIRREYFKEQSKEFCHTVNIMKNKHTKNTTNSLKLLRRIDQLYREVITKIPIELSWMINIYEPHILFNELKNNKKSGDLIYYAWRISPIYKFYCSHDLNFA